MKGASRDIVTAVVRLPGIPSEAEVQPAPAEAGLRCGLCLSLSLAVQSVRGGLLFASCPCIGEVCLDALRFI